MTQHYDTLRAVIWQDNQLYLIDQRKLPQEHQLISLDNAQDTAKAIHDMVVRGAPAIGITAAYGVVLAARAAYQQSPDNWMVTIAKDMEILANSRPTAVNLCWALQRMQALFSQITGNPESVLLAAAQKIQAEDIAANYFMGELGAGFLPEKSCVLTHCNTGSLATGGYGTALGVIRNGYAGGKITHVYADETRPWLQGARLTAWELVQDNIPVTLIVEGAAATLMRQGNISWVIVGADRITANGDVANKIGTYSLAVLARYHGVKFMVVAPSSTLDAQLSDGSQIVIESRSQAEVLMMNGQAIAATGAQAWNPVFDVTPAELIDVIVTEKGAVEKPTTEKMQKLFIA
ncbi:S-methyl-5-thioribose-1-phosphate isomerase [Beggiatoa leptomitoformis]|uniref:Methylthioribose-1-phosphate isomerase n=1 Tax=Beggiatoa leptomitoformis TaxID=288004 RepID=A0A2N9YBE9_9GAMM|nr:S-methyl-5-thioribose-1-phosphate isomerase [Beggiatoa leptomitoformis]ALG66842.1 S-methyl-5-thioribose-1-phosphate isomerase [Beggiatoa leptomitoformis]AUI67807.1 S-methyl-5-thioribose-1-phosphate isomerase [Beggiatoa leptomitoformis]